MSGSVAPPSCEQIAAFRDALRGFDPDADDALRFERIRMLEELQAAAAAAQAVETAAFAASRRASERARIAANPVSGVGTRRRVARAERGIESDVALARRISPSRAESFLRFAETVPAELPKAFGLFAAGKVSTRRIEVLHQATAWLAAQHRRQVDTELSATLPDLGDREVHQKATAIGQRLDPAAACARNAKAVNERRVSLRPAPESMTWLTALLPLTQGVAAWAALNQAAATARAVGDQRSRGQVMADTLVERITGQVSADAVPVAVRLVMTDRALLGDADDPARVVGHGTVPAQVGRDLLLADTPAARSIRRLFTDPVGRLVAMESDSRCFTPGMAELIRVRDDVCRTPWCDAPIRHIDHVEPAADGGPTTISSGRGLCERCNYAAQAEGAVSRVRRDAAGSLTVLTLTPTGHLHRSRPPDPPGRTGPGPLQPATPRIDFMWDLTCPDAA